MSISKRLREHLDEHGIKYLVITHSPAFTAQEIAARMHIPGRELAKAVVVKEPQGLALVVLRAQDRVDLGSIGGDARLASEEEFRNAFPDCEVGAMPPMGNLYGIPTLVDEALSRDEEIVFNAGTHTEAIRLDFSDFVAVTKPRIGRFAEPHLVGVR